MKQTAKQAKKHGKPVILNIFNMFDNTYNSGELLTKTELLYVFSPVQNKMCKTHAKRSIFTKIDMTH